MCPEVVQAPMDVLCCQLQNFLHAMCGNAECEITGEECKEPHGCGSSTRSESKGGNGNISENTLKATLSMSLDLNIVRPIEMCLVLI